MRRSILVGMTLVAACTSVFLFLALLGSTPVAAGSLVKPAASEADKVEVSWRVAGSVPGVPQTTSSSTGYWQSTSFGVASPDAFVSIVVNYAHNWVAGETDPGSPLTVTLVDDANILKDEAILVAESDGSFFTGDCILWNLGECPDIAAGDAVTVTTSGASGSVNPIGEIHAVLNDAENTVAGTIHAPWFTQALSVTCMVWVDPGPGPAPIVTAAEPDGGGYLCDFDDVGWDLAPGQDVAVMYTEPDGDYIINVFGFPWMRVNYAHDWVGGEYAAGHTLWLTVTDSIGEVKATAQVESFPGAGWSGDGFETHNEDWVPEQPDLVAGDIVTFAADDGYTNAIEIGDIFGNLDVAGDAITGTLAVPGMSEELPVECHPWGAWEIGIGADTRQSSAAGDGSSEYACDWSGEWDIEPGQDVAVMYVDSDLDRVINVFREPVPSLRIAMGAEGNPGQGGNMAFALEYWNDGDGPAENVVITDTMIGMTYLMDTSVFSVMTGTIPGGEYAALDVGTVEPGGYGFIELFVQVTEPAFSTITNTAEIATSNPFDQGDQKVSQWSGEVLENDTHLNAGKSSWTGDPTPDTDVVFFVTVCNNGGTGSSTTLMEDTLHPAFTLLDWWAQHDGWYEVASDSRYLAVANHSIPSGACSDVYLQTHVAAGIEPGTYVTNTAVITAASDLEPDDNEAFWDGRINLPRLNLTIDKGWNGGMLVPGGELRYHISYANDGNQPVGTFQITDTLPVSTTFGGAWTYDETGQHPFDPILVGDGYVIWEIAGLANGYNASFEVAVLVDENATPGTTLVNMAAISPQPDEDLSDNLASWTETLYGPGPNLRVRKSHSWNGDAHLAYDLVFENVGDETVSDFWITDSLPLDTNWDGGWGMGFPGDRLTETVETNSLLAWHFTEIHPAEVGNLYFGANLVFPGEPVRWYTNTVEATIPPGDTNLDDNVYDDVAFSGGEVRRVELFVETEHSNMWGSAVSGSPVTVTAPAGQFFAWADPDCGGCWEIGDIGPVYAGDQITVSAAAGILPVVFQVPDPFTAEAESASGLVWGQIDHLDGQFISVELYGLATKIIQTDDNGNFSTIFNAFPRGGDGEVRHRMVVDYANVAFHRYFRSPDLILNVNYGHDWVEGAYEPGHTIWLTATESDQVTVKATAVLTTGPVDWWGGQSGFSTSLQGWQPDQPDLVEGDWIFGLVDNGYTSNVEIGTIEGELDVDLDTVSGTITAPWPVGSLRANCGVWEQDGPGFEFSVDPNGGDYFCDFATAGWDLLPGQQVGVAYEEPDKDLVINVFEDPVPDLQINKSSPGGGIPGEGGEILLLVEYWNHGGAAAEDVVITDTMAGLSYLTDTLGVPSTGGGSGPIVWELGTVEADTYGWFYVFADVLGAAGETVTNTVEITTSNPYERGGAEELVSTWAAAVTAEGTEVNLGKWSWTDDPAPGTPFVFVLNPCNSTGVMASNVVITDTLHPSMTLQLWWSDYPGWTEVASAPGELVVGKPALPAYACEQVYVEVALSPEAWPGMPLTNTAVIAATNDQNLDDNTAFWGGAVGGPHVNLAVDKWLNWGVLVPGGEIRYTLHYQNTGNVPVAGPILLTDTLPAGTSFLGAWSYDSQGQPHPVEPLEITDEVVVWEVGDLTSGESRDFEMALLIHSAAQPGLVLTNTLAISPQPDEDSYDDNVALWVEEAHAPGPNLRVRKWAQWQDWGYDRPVAQYWTSIENIGSAPVGPVDIVDAYPAEMVLEGEPDAEWWRLEDWADDPGNHTLTATFSFLQPGETTWLNFAAIVAGPEPMPEGTFFTNTIEVLPANGEVYLDDNVAQRGLSSGPDLAVEKHWIAGEALPGELITFSLVFGNDRQGYEWWWNMEGPAWLTDTLPEGLSFVGSQLRHCDELGNPCDFGPSAIDGSQLVWELWPLGASEWNEIWLTVQITATAEGDDVFGNWVEIGATDPASDADPVAANNMGYAEVPVGLPKFLVGKTFASSQVAGMEVMYNLTLENVGHAAGTGVELTDLLPEGLTYGGGDGLFDGTDVTWFFANLDPGASADGWFSATLPCTEGLDVVNDVYGVSGSAQGVSGGTGPVVSFTVLAPTIEVALDHTAGPIVVGSEVNFAGTAATNGTPLTFAWDFGDGTTGTGLTAAHTYVTNGEFVVVFTATDACGHSASASAVVTISPPNLVAAFTPSAATVETGEVVTFTDTSTTNGPAIVAWAWDFGDGSTGTGLTATHAYGSAGTYTVTLTASDALGYSDSATGTVTVETGMLEVFLPIIILSR